MTRPFISSMLKWYVSHEQIQLPPGMWKSLLTVLTAYAMKTQMQQLDSSYMQLLMLLVHLFLSFDEFIEENSNMSKTFAYWVKFLEAIQIMIDNMRAVREGDWNLHLFSLAKDVALHVCCQLHKLFTLTTCIYVRYCATVREFKGDGGIIGITRMAPALTHPITCKNTKPKQ